MAFLVMGTRSVLFLCVVVITVCACTRDGGREGRQGAVPPRVLFIGSIPTFLNGGIDRQLEGLCPSCETSRIASPGYTLDDHWKKGTAVKAIREGNWRYVVLQEESRVPVLDRQRFMESVRRFDEEVKQAGGQTVLLMNWQQEDGMDRRITTENMENAFGAVNDELHVQVVPAGLAFAKSMKERPRLVLARNDGSPTVFGTYLAACVVYGVLFKVSPLELPSADPSLSPEIRLYLQRMAAETAGLW